MRRLRRAQRLAMPALSLAVLLGAASVGIALASTTETLYLVGTGVPVAQLSASLPAGQTLPNYDPGRDDAPGLALKKGGGANEADPTKNQLWVAAEGAVVLDGPATLTFWSAIKDFDTKKKGKVQAYLLDCDGSGTNCITITSATRKENPWNAEPGWVRRTVNFGTVEYTVADDRSLAVRLVVTDNSHDDMWFAYGSVDYASSLSVQLAQPPPTTTTTTTAAPSPTTTTTAPPPTTTTTTTPPPPATTTTTTAPPRTTTTTSAPPPGAPTTTTTAGPPTTTTTTTPQPTSGTTTTTPSATAAPGEDPPADDPLPQEDVALSPLPVAPSDDDEGGQSGGLLASLDLAIPPAVASSLSSPLLLVQSILGAFWATGRGLLIPCVLLAIGIGLLEGRRRRSGLIADDAEVQT